MQSWLHASSCSRLLIQGSNHHARAFSGFLAGAGVKGGITYGETDEYGIAIGPATVTLNALLDWPRR